MKVGPYVHSVIDRNFKWARVVEGALDTIIDGNNARGNKTRISEVLKSEAWLTGYCTGNCANNCTGSYGGEPVWSYLQKQVNPIKEDVKVLDTSIRIMCKGMITSVAAVT